MAQFVDYEQVAPNAWQFQRDDGKPMVLMGPDAAVLTQQIDRQREAQRSQMLAQNGGPPSAFPSRLDAVGGYGPASAPPPIPGPPPQQVAPPPPPPGSAASRPC